jgi:hypothetical protein
MHTILNLRTQFRVLHDVCHLQHDHQRLKRGLGKYSDRDRDYQRQTIVRELNADALHHFITDRRVRIIILHLVSLLFSK